MIGKPDGAGWTALVDGPSTSIRLSGKWIARSGGMDFAAAAAKSMRPDLKTLTFDASHLEHWDTALIAFLLALRDAAKQQGVVFEENGLPPPARRLLALAPEIAGERKQPQSRSVLERTGLSAIAMWGGFDEGLALIGNVVLRGGPAVFTRKSMRLGDLVEMTYDAGFAALPIVLVVNLLVGGILAFVGADELRIFGAGIYVADLVGIGTVREMAALMTAIIMAGRTGGAFAATIAAMQGAEEIDALRAFGISVFDYLILPRILTLTTMMPILYLFGCAAGIFGGFCVGTTVLKVTATAFFVQAQLALSIVQFGIGLSKSVLFGALIAIVSCVMGLRAGRSAAAVGMAATSAVVAAIVAVIGFDAVFDVCANVLRI